MEQQRKEMYKAAKMMIMLRDGIRKEKRNSKASIYK